MQCETDIKGIKGVLEPSGDWQTVHRGIIQRPFEIEIILSDGTKPGDYNVFIETRWVQAEDDWHLQFRNKKQDSLPFSLRWYTPASERLCCYDYGRGD